jgi:hypothetical protein
MTRRSGSAERGNGRTAPDAAADGTTAVPPSSPPSSGAAPDDVFNLRERLDRLGEILVRGLDLAEAGLSLGMTIVTTVGAAAQQKLFDRILDTPPTDTPSPGPVPPAGVEPDPPAYGVTNRTPLVPGSAVSISFSINNDSAAAPKNVALSVEGFAGQQAGAFLPLNTVRVTPSSAVIAPMDFEKFVLEGVVPAGATPDVYRGSVLVASDVDMSIPVLLVVRPGGSG